MESSQAGGIVDSEKDELSPVVPQADVEQAGLPVSKETAASDWTSPKDPDNPQNWPLWLRQYHVVPPALISFTASCGSSIYTPALDQIMEDFGVSTTVALFPLSFYVIALGLGPMLGAPLSETFGRRTVYLVSPILAALFTVGAGFSPTFAGLVILRFFSGVFFSPSLAIGAGTLADVFPASERAFATSIYILSPFLGPALGPVIGSFVAVGKWQWTQWTLAIFAIFSWLSVLPTKETYKKTILARRAKALRVPPAPSPFPTFGAKAKFLLTVTLLRPLHMLFTEPIVGFLSSYIAFNFGVLFTFFAAFPYVFDSVYHFSTETSGLVFLAIGVGCLLAVPTTMLCDRYLYMKQFRLSQAEGREGIVKPEYRLYPAMLGSFGLPIGLFWFAWSARRDVHWISPVLAAIPFGWGNLSIFIASGMYLVDTYGAMNGASALAANGLLRYIFGFAFPLFTFQMYKGMGIGWATSLLGFVTVALMPIPWVLYKFGHQIRAKSQYDTIKA